MIVKRLLANAPPERKPKLVLMSATMNTGLFSHYFCPQNPPKSIEVQVRTHPVTVHHLSNLLDAPMIRKSIRGPFTHVDLERMSRRLDSVYPAHDSDMTDKLYTLLVWLCRALTTEHHTCRYEPPVKGNNSNPTPAEAEAKR